MSQGGALYTRARRRSEPAASMAETPAEGMALDGDAGGVDTVRSLSPGGGAEGVRSPGSPLSSSSGSESDEEEGAEEAQVQALERALSENPMDYDTHVQYIQSLRKLGFVEKLRQARESMNEHFPLSPSMWQEWVKDEASLHTDSEAFTEIEKLYERGVHEYLSVSLWCAYLDFVQEHDPSVLQCTPAGILKMRNLFERALTSAGLHVTEGSKLWEAYREYEQAILFTMADNTQEEKAKQIQRIRSLFHRQLSLPLVDLKATFISYKHWEAEQGNLNDANSSELDGISPNVVSAYQKAMEMYNARALYEDQLSNLGASDADKLQHFMNYMKFEESSGDPARVQILYERAVCEFPISSDLWLGYTSYLDRTLKVPDVLRGVYSKATRNCSWVGDLWVRYLLSLERVHASEEELSTVFEKSIQCIFPSFKEYLDLFLTRVDGLRRRISPGSGKEDGLDCSLIRETFQRAVKYLSPQLVNTDDLLRLHAYWARLEVNLGKDLIAARGVWESLIKRSGSMLEVWQCYIAMEIEMGHINEARSIYKRCYSKRFSGTGSEDICHSWLRFEREYGTLEDFDLAVRKVTPRLQELMIFRMQDSKDTRSQEDKFVAKPTPQKRKMNKISVERKQTAKRQKRSTPTASEGSDGGPTKKRGVKDDAEVVDKVEVPTLTKPDSDATNKKAEESNSRDSKLNFYTDQCTAFISNLSLQANEGHLREFFSDCGVTAIRLLRDKFTGRSRGLAYVDFSDDDHLAAAVAKNKQKLLGQKLSIARSDPKRRPMKSSAGQGTSKGHGRGWDHGGRAEVSESAVVENHGSKVKLVGKNTFAAPRALVTPLGWSKKELRTEGSAEEPKSNEEFREMLLKK